MSELLTLYIIPTLFVEADLGDTHMNHVADKELKLHLHRKLKSTFQKTIDNPVIKARQSWDLVSEQLLYILGPEVHQQWFKPITPLVLKNNILILQTETNFAAQWINTHYQQLVEALILTQDKKLSCFFIAPTKKKNS